MGALQQNCVNLPLITDFASIEVLLLLLEQAAELVHLLLKLLDLLAKQRNVCNVAQRLLRAGCHRKIRGYSLHDA